jgi:transcription-repair coupling factor (superfamily II helicase)
MVQDELTFRFGDFPQELKNLFAMMLIKNKVKQYGIDSINLKKNEIKVSFYRPVLDKEVEFAQSLVQKMIHHPGIFKITPDYSLTKSISKRDMTFKEVEDLLQSLTPAPRRS